MLVEEAEVRLRSMLAAAGLDLARLDPRGAFDVFAAFAGEPVEIEGSASADDDMVIFQFGVYDWHDGKGARFEWNLTRQFAVYVEGEYDRLEQLRCDLFYPPTGLEALGAGQSSWWAAQSAPEWKAEVEAMAGFSAVLGQAPVESVVAQSAV